MQTYTTQQREALLQKAKLISENTEQQINELFKRADEIENWLKAHWNDEGPHVREQRRRLFVLLDEINLLLDLHKVCNNP